MRVQPTPILGRGARSEQFPPSYLKYEMRGGSYSVLLVLLRVICLFPSHVSHVAGRYNVALGMHGLYLIGLRIEPPTKHDREIF